MADFQYDLLTKAGELLSALVATAKQKAKKPKVGTGNGGGGDSSLSMSVMGNMHGDAAAGPAAEDDDVARERAELAGMQGPGEDTAIVIRDLVKNFTTAGLAVGETVILLTPPFLFLLKHLLKVEGGAAELTELSPTAQAGSRQTKVAVNNLCLRMKYGEVFGDNHCECSHPASVLADCMTWACTCSTCSMGFSLQGCLGKTGPGKRRRSTC